MSSVPVSGSSRCDPVEAVIDYPKLPGACKAAGFLCALRRKAFIARRQVQVEPELGLLVDIVYTKDPTGTQT